MTNFYAYINRHDNREAQAIYEAELERKRQRQAKIDSFFAENLCPGNQVVLDTVAMSSDGLILKDDIGGDFWVASWDKSEAFRLRAFKRCSTLEEAKSYFFALSEESP